MLGPITVNFIVFHFAEKFKGKHKDFNEVNFLFGKVGQWDGLMNN